MTLTPIRHLPDADLLRLVLGDAGALDWPQQLAGTMIVRRGVNGRGRELTYLLNYSKDPVDLTLPVGGADVLGTTGEPGTALAAGDAVAIPAWGVLVLEGQTL